MIWRANQITGFYMMATLAHDNIFWRYISAFFVLKLHVELLKLHVELSYKIPSTASIYFHKCWPWNILRESIFINSSYFTTNKSRKLPNWSFIYSENFQASILIVKLASILITPTLFIYCSIQTNLEQLKEKGDSY